MKSMVCNKIENTIKTSILDSFKAELDTYGVKRPHNINFEQNAILYLDFINRNYYNLKKWKCVESKELNYSKNLKKGYEALIKALESGVGITKYQSKSLFNRRHTDKMFYDWGIVHFHLGEINDSNRFIQRTKSLAFVKFHLDTAYIIAIGDHHSWTDENLISILHYEFPSTILNYKSSTHTDAESLIEDTQNIRYEMRKCNVNMPIVLDDGSFYMAINGGFSTNGTHFIISDSLVTLQNLINKLVHHIKTWIQVPLFKRLITTRDEWGIKVIGLVFYEPIESRFITVTNTTIAVI